VDEDLIIRVLFADHEPLFREAIRVVLDNQPDLLVVAEAQTGCQAAELAEELAPDIALLADDLPECEGVDGVKLIIDRAPRCRVLVLARDEDQDALLKALEAGAAGFVTRTNPLGELIAAIRALHRGEAMVPPKMLGPLLAALIRRRREQAAVLQRVSTLTRREREVLLLVCRGADSRSIAEELVISPETARTHVQNVLSKLGVHSRPEAAAMFGPDDLLDQLVEMGH
jgi:two-component system nitrate/nitrite response regulator NarL